MMRRRRQLWDERSRKIHLDFACDLKVMISLLIFVFLHSACQSPSTLSPEAERYVNLVERLQKSADRLDDVIDTQVRQATLPRTRERRFSLPDPPTLRFRDFFGLSDCSLSRLIAYRNSPLGKVMLASQRLAYEQRFLRESQRCDFSLMKPKLRESIETAILYKETHWSKLHSNAIWGGRELASYLSISAPRNLKIRRVGSEDEATLIWLSKLKSDSSEVSDELEQQLKTLPPYVGGRTILSAARLMAILDWTLMRVRLKLEQVQRESESHRNSEQCKLILRALEAFGSLQRELSESYRALKELTRALSYLSKLTPNAPSRSMESYWSRWATEGEQSAVHEFERLSRESVHSWSRLQALAGCEQTSSH